MLFKIVIFLQDKFPLIINQNTQNVCLLIISLQFEHPGYA